MRRDEISLIEVWAIARDIAVAHGTPMNVAIQDVLAARDILNKAEAPLEHMATCAGTGDPAACGCRQETAIKTEVEQLQRSMIFLQEMLHEAAGQILSAVRRTGAGE